MAAFPDLLRKDRERRGFTVGQVAYRLGITPDEYRALEAGDAFPDFETWDRICKLYGWPQTFVGSQARGSHALLPSTFQGDLFMRSRKA
jgi:transcriptional regulator with XRE-family HTH domain